MNRKRLTFLVAGLSIVLGMTAASLTLRGRTHPPPIDPTSDSNSTANRQDPASRPGPEPYSVQTDERSASGVLDDSVHSGDNAGVPPTAFQPLPSTVEEMLDQFEAKYAEQSIEELAAAEAKLKKDLKLAASTAQNERLALGFFDVFPYEYDQDGRKLSVASTERYKLAYERPLSDMLMVGQYDMPDLNEWRCVPLPRELYGHIYVLGYERMWLGVFKSARANSNWRDAVQQARAMFTAENTD